MADPFFDFAWRRAINCSGTRIRASKDAPIMVTGFQYTLVVDGVAEVWFIITNVPDLRTLPGFDEDVMQIPYHEAEENGFKLGATDCEAP